MTEMLYDKTGSAFTLDHEHEGTAYVRPLIKVVHQSTSYHGDDFHETEDYEPAEYLVAMDRDTLFDAPPVMAVNQEIADKQVELKALKSDAAKATKEINSARNDAESQLRAAKRQLDEWMKSHRVMMDLGKLLDGQVLYPLSVKENPYHHGRDIPRIPEMRNAGYLTIRSGDFEKGQKWVCKEYASDCYGSPFRFFDTEEERTAEIRSEFDATCQKFRENPNFDTTRHTTTTRLHYGTLTEWVKTHPALIIPSDIENMKANHDAELVEKHKIKLAAELAELETPERDKRGK